MSWEIIVPKEKISKDFYVISPRRHGSIIRDLLYRLNYGAEVGHFPDKEGI